MFITEAGSMKTRAPGSRGAAVLMNGIQDTGRGFAIKRGSIKPRADY